MQRMEELIERLEQLAADVDALDDPLRERILELLDGVDAVHRLAISRLAAVLGPERVDEMRSEPAIAWLFAAYGIGIDERARAQEALAALRPYIDSHGGSVEIVDVDRGVVRVRLAGSCAGCTGSDVTLREGVEAAMRENLPGFVALDVEEDDAAPHPPPGATLLQIGRPPR